MPLVKHITKLPIWAQFVVNILILYFIWIIFYKFLRDWWLIDYLYEELIYYFTIIQLEITKYLLNILGYKAGILGKIIYIKGTFGVLLDRGCLGRNTLGLFIGFILAYPSRLRDKLWIIPVGIIIFLILNILRITGLVLIEYYCPQYLAINHEFIFKAVIYISILIIWAIWIKLKKFPSLKKENKHSNKNPQIVKRLE